MSNQDYALGQLESKAAVRAQELRILLGQLGASFVKVGQALSSRPDLLPQVYLEVCHKKDPQHQYWIPIEVKYEDDIQSRYAMLMNERTNPKVWSIYSYGMNCIPLCCLIQVDEFGCRVSLCCKTASHRFQHQWRSQSWRRS